MSIKPEDILSDSDNYGVVKGVTIRKGTIAALFANVVILENKQSSVSEKEDAKEAIQKLLPALVALGISDHIIFKNKEIQGWAETLRKTLGQ